MQRDEDLPRGGFNSSSYTDTLEEGLVPVYNGETFMQDNAPIHTSRQTIAWFASKGIYLLPNWPPYSPDLNPIEHLWYHLKQMIYELLPHLDEIQGKPQQLEAIIDILPQAWQRIRTDIIKEVIDSMPRRLQAVIDAQGWQTRY